MSNKIAQLIKKISKIYAERGFRGLQDVIASKIRFSTLPLIYKNGLLRRIYYPKLKMAYLEVTNNCNLKCKMCIYTKLKIATGYMSKSLFESCVDQLSQMGVETLYLHFGGESLVHPHFKDYLRYAISKRNKGGIANVAWVENGMLFSRDIADLVVDLEVDQIGFSIDGIGQVNDNIRLGSNYSVIEKNIKYLLKRRGISKKPEIYLSMCEYGKTEEQKLDVYREWIPFVDSITLIPSILPDNTWEDKDEASRTLGTIKPPNFCCFPLEIMAISWDGKVTGCCLDYIFKMDLGDAKKESLKQIWRGARYQSLRRAVVTNSFPVESPCRKCEFWQINFEPREQPILNGTGSITYGYIYRIIKSISSSEKTTPKENER